MKYHNWKKNNSRKPQQENPLIVNGRDKPNDDPLGSYFCKGPPRETLSTKGKISIMIIVIKVMDEVITHSNLFKTSFLEL